MILTEIKATGKIQNNSIKLNLTKHKRYAGSVATYDVQSGNEVQGSFYSSEAYTAELPWINTFGEKRKERANELSL